MKLIELLARELKEWPSKGDTHAWQDYESMEIRFNHNIAGDFVATERADDCQRRRGDPHPNDPSGYVTREQWEAARHVTTPTLETMLTEWRDLEARAQAAQAEADALFEHAGQCHGEIVVRLAELGWGKRMVPGAPVVTLDEPDAWVVEGHTAPDDATHWGPETSEFYPGFYKQSDNGWSFWSVYSTRGGQTWRPIIGDDPSRFISRPSTRQ